jgi:hypothetical protein
MSPRVGLVTLLKVNSLPSPEIEPPLSGSLVSIPTDPRRLVNAINAHQKNELRKHVYSCSFRPLRHCTSQSSLFIAVLARVVMGGTRHGAATRE